MRDVKTLGDSRRSVAIHACSIALMAAVLTLVFHELCHALAAILLGAREVTFSFYRVGWKWPGPHERWKDLVVAGNAAVMNGLVGLICAAVFRWLSRPGVALFMMYLGAYSLFTGFGYVLTDPLFYSAQSQVGDWKQVVYFLGGGWQVRIGLSSIGLVGYLFGGFWLATTLRRFRAAGMDAIHLYGLLALFPYFVSNIFLTAMSFWHPLKMQGVVLTLLMAWCGYAGFVWAWSMASYWMKPQEPSEKTTDVPARISHGWVVVCLLVASLCVVFLRQPIHLTTALAGNTLPAR